MLLLLLVFKGIAFFDHVEVCYAPVMGPVDLLAPADNVCGRKLGALENRLQTSAIPAYMVTRFFRNHYFFQKFFRC
jgi:hypothetical protein